MSKTILVVDDENALEAYRHILQPEYNLVIARMPSEALRQLSTNPSIDLLVVDLELPEMLGDEFIIESHKLRPDIRKVLTKAPGSPGDPDTLLRSFRTKGIEEAAYLPKPIDAGELLSLVRSLIQG